MPSIELDGHSDARFVLIDGKIVRQDAPPVSVPSTTSFDVDRRLRP